MMVRVRRTFGDRPTEVAAARRFVARFLSDAALGQAAIRNAQLAVSELATNALLHAGSPFTVEVVLDGDIRIAVKDDSPLVPRPRDAADLEAGGRGMRILEMVGVSWGVSPEGVGKWVWVELERDPLG